MEIKFYNIILRIFPAYFFLLVLFLWGMMFGCAPESPQDGASLPHVQTRVTSSVRGALVTGIDLDVVMARIIKDYKNFHKARSLGENVIAFRWRVNPDPNLSETQYFGKPLKESSFYQREIRLSIGVYRSREEARRRTIDRVQGDAARVWENVFLSVDFCTLPFDRHEILRSFERDLVEGAEGIITDPTRSIPSITVAIPDRLIIPSQSNATATVHVDYPDRIHTQPYLWFVEEGQEDVDSIPSSLAEKKSSAPVLHWIDDRTIELLERGNVKGRLCAVVVSDHCVFSDVWEKEIEIHVPDEQSVQN